MDKRLEKGHETKERILNASLLIISEKGINGLTAQGIADCAQVSKGNIFHHYSSVENLLDIILTRFCVGAMTNIPLDHCKSVEEFFLLIGESVFNLKGEGLAVYRSLFSFYNESLFNSRYEKTIVEILKDVCIFLQRHLTRITGKDIPFEFVKLLMADLDGMGLHYMLEKDSEKFLQLWQSKGKMYIRYIDEL